MLPPRCCCTWVGLGCQGPAARAGSNSLPALPALRASPCASACQVPPRQGPWSLIGPPLWVWGWQVGLGARVCSAGSPRPRVSGGNAKGWKPPQPSLSRGYQGSLLIRAAPELARPPAGVSDRLPAGTRNPESPPSWQPGTWQQHRQNRDLLRQARGVEGQGRLTGPAAGLCFQPGLGTARSLLPALSLPTAWAERLFADVCWVLQQGQEQQLAFAKEARLALP